MEFSCTWRVRGGRDSYASSAFSLYSNYLARCSALCDNFYMHGAQQTVVMMGGGTAENYHNLLHIADTRDEERVGMGERDDSET